MSNYFNFLNKLAPSSLVSVSHSLVPTSRLAFNNLTMGDLTPDGPCFCRSQSKRLRQLTSSSRSTVAGSRSSSFDSSCCLFFQPCPASMNKKSAEHSVRTVHLGVTNIEQMPTRTYLLLARAPATSPKQMPSALTFASGSALAAIHSSCSFASCCFYSWRHPVSVNE